MGGHSALPKVFGNCTQITYIIFYSDKEIEANPSLQKRLCTAYHRAQMGWPWTEIPDHFEISRLLCQARWGCMREVRQISAVWGKQIKRRSIVKHAQWFFSPCFQACGSAFEPEKMLICDICCGCFHLRWTLCLLWHIDLSCRGAGAAVQSFLRYLTQKSGIVTIVQMKCVFSLDFSQINGHNLSLCRCTPAGSHWEKSNPLRESLHCSQKLSF